jgi:hypothetical protein
LKWNSDSNVQIDFVKRSVYGFVFRLLVRQIKVPEGGRSTHGDYVQGTGSKISAKGRPEPGSAALAVLVEESEDESILKARAYSNPFSTSLLTYR